MVCNRKQSGYLKHKMPFVLFYFNLEIYSSPLSSWTSQPPCKRLEIHMKKATDLTLRHLPSIVSWRITFFDSGSDQSRGSFVTCNNITSCKKNKQKISSNQRVIKGKQRYTPSIWRVFQFLKKSTYKSQQQAAVKTRTTWMTLLWGPLGRTKGRMQPTMPQMMVNRRTGTHEAPIFWIENLLRDFTSNDSRVQNRCQTTELYNLNSQFE